MRTEAILLIEAKCFGMWWPGRELNPRRQPFQGCALPPELPGHFCSYSFVLHRPSKQMSVKTRRSETTTGGRLDRALLRFHWAGCHVAKQPTRWDRAEPPNYNNAVPFAQNACRRFSPYLTSRPLLSFFLRFFFMTRKDRRARH
jgi:hypothetical protein